MEPSTCQICTSPNSEIITVDSDKREFKVNCDTCGTYYFIDPVYRVRVISITGVGLSKSELKKLSFLLRHNYEFANPITLTLENIDQLLEDFEPSNDLIERIEFLILYVYKSLKHPADSVKISNMLPIVFCDDQSEFIYYLGIANELGLLKNHTNISVKLTPRGWIEAKKLLEKKVDSKKAFAAMWFSEEVDLAWKSGIYPALYNLGYNALRIDKKEHNEKIDDHIIAEIRKSGLLVADFTGNRNGVYFEAGFAMGLGIPVIWTCRKDHLDEVHFDTRQYNHIVWENPEELKEKLTYRIEATIPNRPAPRNTEDQI